MIESFVTGVVDNWPNKLRRHRKLFTFAVAFTMFLLSLPMLTQVPSFVRFEYFYCIFMISSSWMNQYPVHLIWNLIGLMFSVWCFTKRFFCAFNRCRVVCTFSKFWIIIRPVECPCCFWSSSRPFPYRGSSEGVDFVTASSKWSAVSHQLSSTSAGSSSHLLLWL